MSSPATAEPYSTTARSSAPKALLRPESSWSSVIVPRVAGENRRAARSPVGAAATAAAATAATEAAEPTAAAEAAAPAPATAPPPAAADGRDEDRHEAAAPPPAPATAPVAEDDHQDHEQREQGERADPPAPATAPHRPRGSRRAERGVDLEAELLRVLLRHAVG